MDPNPYYYIYAIAKPTIMVFAHISGWALVEEISQKPSELTHDSNFIPKICMLIAQNEDFPRIRIFIVPPPRLIVGS